MKLEILKKLPILSPEEVAIAVIVKNGGATLEEMKDIWGILSGLGRTYSTWYSIEDSLRIMEVYGVVRKEGDKYYLNEGKLFGPIIEIGKYVAEKLKEAGL